MAKVICLGAALQDVFLIDHDDFDQLELADGTSLFADLKLGEKVDIDKVVFETGGGGTNAAVTLARAGHRTWFIGRIGRDIPGEMIAEKLIDEDINIDHMIYARKRTGYSTILLAPGGERTIMTYRGASAEYIGLNSKSVKQIKPEWMYVTTVRGDIELLKDFFGMAAKRDVKIMWNPGNKELEQRAETLRLLRYVEVLLVNRGEAEALVGEKLEIEGLALELLKKVESVIITDGRNGAYAANKKEYFRVGLYEEVKVKDATGAGDAFGSGFLAEYARSGDWTQALTYASANSTGVVQFVGAKKGIIEKGIKLKKMKIETGGINV